MLLRHCARGWGQWGAVVRAAAPDAPHVVRLLPTRLVSPARLFSSGSAEELQKEIDEINSLFVEARDEIEMAQEDAETTYFNDSYKAAKEATDAALGRWHALLNRLEEGERQRLMRSMGLKMGQLSQELKQLDELHS